MCMKDTDLLIENNMQPILVFQKLDFERKLLFSALPTSDFFQVH